MDKYNLIINIISALLTPTIAICTAFFMWQQKEIQKKQQKAELLQLRIEHIRNIFDTWGTFHQDIKYIKNYKAQIIVPNGMNNEDVIYNMEKIIAKLYKLNFSTKYLFAEDIYNSENKIIKSLKNFIPSRGTPWSIYNLPLEEYAQNRDMFDDLYKKYNEIMDKENRLCE